MQEILNVKLKKKKKWLEKNLINLIGINKF